MAVIFTDVDIQRLIVEPKPLPMDFTGLIQLKDKRGHRERELSLTGQTGNDFRLILRQSAENPLDFSIIVGVWPRTTGIFFRLRRYNGKSHQHTNVIEGNSFFGFHVHMATERYQDLGAREDSFAELATEFSDLNGALRCMFRDCCFQNPSTPQPDLFPEV